MFRATTQMNPLSWTQRSHDGIERIELRFSNLPLGPGHYCVNVALWNLADNSAQDRILRAAELDVVGGSNVFGSGYQSRQVDGLIYLQHEWALWTAERDSGVGGAARA